MGAYGVWPRLLTKVRGKVRDRLYLNKDGRVAGEHAGSLTRGRQQPRLFLH